MVKEKLGRIVWHDLFTPEEDASRSFYRSLAGWTYSIEHATDFAWGGGSKDFTLAILDGEAGAGIVSQNLVRFEGWIPYIEVEDVDQTAKLAKSLGGAVIKPPFEVPGVGRNCLLSDPLGAYLGISVSRHDFPVPMRQFALEHYLTRSGDIPAQFYRELFGWCISSIDDASSSQRAIRFEGDVLAKCTSDRSVFSGIAAWIPGIRVSSLEQALKSVRRCEGLVLTRHQHTQNTYASALVHDPMGALFNVVQI
ncbi:VOC family protein [Ruegeria sp. R13_0]|uniref:VOC family protein n=1 Tax=Ruegeria sp. R13_0 TaxID=2821099 RepID=UPI001ADA7A43|nr:VOC family protein [Ruegeria sp. R13_0]MBO9433733.1 VOC family protein [Ruegeria sp. R13_0]